MQRVFVKIFLWFWGALVLVGLSLYVAVMATTTPIEERMHRFSDQAVEDDARTAAEAFGRGGPPALAAYLAKLEGATRIRGALFGEDGREIADRGVLAKGAALATRARVTQHTELDADRLTALKARAVSAPGGQDYVFVAALPTGSLRLLHDAPAAQLLRLVAVLLPAGGLCYMLARHVAAPVATLRAATREMATGNLAVRVGPAMGRRKDEFADLGRDFNRMAERIESLVTAERRLLRDISHELRSPLSRLSVALGLARQRSGEEQAALGRIEREAERLNGLIGRLLVISRLETGTDEGARELVDLARIVREVADDADFEARGGDRTVWLSESQRGVVIGNAELLRSAIENVVRNAVRHTYARTAVEIAVRCADFGDPSRVVISVRDHGPGVPEHALSEIFRPFYRVGDGRERANGGVGLGLTIAHRTIRLHGGTIRAANAPDGGLRVEISLPAAPVGLGLRPGTARS